MSHDRRQPNIVAFSGGISAAEREALAGGPGLTVWLTGLSGSGKSTIAHAVEERLIGEQRMAYVLDGDNLRRGINSDLGFSSADRTENVRRVGEIARLMNDAGLVVLVPVISPFEAARREVARSHESNGLRYAEIHVHAPLSVCEARDPKGLYARARAGEIAEFTGIDSPYETPTEPDLLLDTGRRTLGESVDLVLEVIENCASRAHRR